MEVHHDIPDEVTNFGSELTLGQQPIRQLRKRKLDRINKMTCLIILRRPNAPQRLDHRLGQLVKRGAAGKIVHEAVANGRLKGFQ